MKLTIALLFVAVIGFVCAEHCGNTDDCQRHHATHCHMHTHIVCNNNFCECSMGPTGQTCTQLTDCSSVDCSHHGNQHNAHCVDGHCQCTMRPPPGGN